MTFHYIMDPKTIDDASIYRQSPVVDRECEEQVITETHQRQPYSYVWPASGDRLLAI